MMNMTQPELPPAFLIAESPALDFLNTVAQPADIQYDWLDSTPHLLNWLDEAGLVTTEEIKQFHQPKWLETHKELATQARELRDWFRYFVETHAGKPLTTSALSALKPINKILSNDDYYFQIQPQDKSDTEMDNHSENLVFHQKKVRRWQNTDNLLLPIAEAISELLCNIDWSLIKQCEGPTCTLWFLDVSKNRKRRWCTMAICGNRAKVAKHRANKK